VHAVAAIGHPQQFFAALEQLGIQVAPHALPDHARLTAADISFPDALPVLMTEKDAVKSRAIADQRHWAVRMDVMVTEQDAAAVQAMLDRLG
jgi:tetraacyldisaccharide 4'-kinase